MNKRILLVDDERNLNQLIATNLKFEGYETESAYSGIEAIDKLGRFSPDLVVLDVMMPGMDGFEVLEHLRHASSIPVILLTAKNRVDDRIRGLTLGADDYLGKPFAIDELTARIEAVLRRSNVVCGILRGLGDSKTPLYFVGLACVINIMLDFILVGYFHWGATGAAIATVTAQGVSFGIALWFLYRHGFHFDFSRKDIRLNRNLSKKIMVLGAPIALQDALINVSFLIITVIVNQMGVIASASLGVVEKIIVFAMLPPMAISSAVATMTAQNYGAGLIKRMNKCLASGIGIALVFGVSVCVYSQFLPETLTAFFTKDAAVVAMAADYLRGYSIDCIVVSFVFCINSYFSGQGNSLFPMIHSLIATFLFRIPLSYWFSQIDSSSLFIMGFAPPISTVVSLLICIWYLRYTQRKLYLRGTMMPAMSN